MAVLQLKAERNPTVSKQSTKPATVKAAPSKAPHVSATAPLWALADQLADEHGPLLAVGMFRDAAVAAGLNRTSAGIAFYRWQAARTAGVQGVPKGASKAQSYDA